MLFLVSLQETRQSLWLRMWLPSLLRLRLEAHGKIKLSAALTDAAESRGNRKKRKARSEE